MKCYVSGFKPIQFLKLESVEHLSVYIVELVASLLDLTTKNHCLMCLISLEKRSSNVTIKYGAYTYGRSSNPVECSKKFLL